MPLHFPADTTATSSSLPFAHYHCGCPSLKTNHPERSEDNVDPPLADDAKASYSPPSLLSSGTAEDTIKHGTTDLQLVSLDFVGGLYPLSWLYFCEDCHEIRCPQCVQDEIVSYYCPNCLFELTTVCTEQVPTASVKGEKNRCARNCFQCPLCHNTLAVNASQESTSSSTQVKAGPYVLVCSVCRWNSQEINMLFEKPTGLAQQLLKNEDNLAATREFNHLKAHFEQHLRVNATPLPSSLLSLSNLGNFGKTIGSNRSEGGTSRHGSPFYSLQLSTIKQQQQQGLLDDITTYEPLERAPDTESGTLELLMGLQCTDSISTWAQRNTQLYEQPYLIHELRPQRTHLRIKRSKRCRTCRHFLIKPEPKAQTTRFKIKLVARNYLPTITIAALLKNSAVAQTQHPRLSLGVSTQFALKFTNPLYEELAVSLAIPSTATQHDQQTIHPDKPTHPLSCTVIGEVAIITPHFTISPYNETVEYDDEMFPVGSTHDSAPPMGVYSKRNNSTSILVEVAPQALGEFKFPLLVTCKYKPDEGRMDMSLDDVDPEADMESSIDGSRKSSSLMPIDDDKTKCYSFWCLIGLGNVVEPSSSSLF